ncbi:MAG: cation transporter, partial [bacterium]|nr:cation transporter [bacterium]
MTTTSTYLVEGMTCGHCVAAVTAELSALSSVSAVDVVLDPGDASTV